MATKPTELGAGIINGPSSRKMTRSLEGEKGIGPFGIDMTLALSVHFTADGSHPERLGAALGISGFSASIIGMVRESGAEDSWDIEGIPVGDEQTTYPFSSFKGYYNARTHAGRFTFFMNE